MLRAVAWVHASILRAKRSKQWSKWVFLSFPKVQFDAVFCPAERVNILPKFPNVINFFSQHFRQEKNNWWLVEKHQISLDFHEWRFPLKNVANRAIS
jgi:hypothetical protein